ncbi:putative aliphatic sulfonates transport permease protein SsuC [Abditibacteriota bacterium]|nr:putative aliphatic sulfonates transport permease protein SsuC [Abditibacteriota bacterium]
MSSLTITTSEAVSPPNPPRADLHLVRGAAVTAAPLTGRGGVSLGAQNAPIGQLQGRPTPAELRRDKEKKAARTERFFAVLPWVLPVALLLIWQLSASQGWLSPRFLPAPSAVWGALADVVHSGQIWRDAGISAKRALLGLLIGGGLGFLFGVINGAIHLFDKAFDTSMQMARTIPNLALMPLMILWFGIGEETKVLLVALGTFFPLYLNTYHGIRSADNGLKEMGRIYGLSPWGLFAHVIFPGALPNILIGLRFALGTMWLTLIAAEGLAADSGIGYMTSTAREFMRTDIVLLGTLIYALLGKGADLGAKLLERTLLPWHQNFQKTARTR